MAKADRFIALEIGTDCIRLAIATREPDGISVISEGSVTIDHADSGMAYEAVVAMALKRLLADVKPGIRRTVISVEGTSVFSRLIKLPPVAADMIPRTIRHEAVQNIPFPLDEVVWDAHIFDDSQSEPEVLLVAVKSDLINGLVHAASANGLMVERVVPAPVALADAVRNEISDAASTPILLADIGAGVANLVFVDGLRTFFRTIPAIGDTVSHLVHEIERSISFYGNQQGGRVPEKMLVSSDGSCHPEDFVGRFSFPVHGFEPACLGGEHAHSSAVLAGIGVHDLAELRLEVNLLPKMLQDEKASRGRKLLQMFAAVLVLLLAGFWGWFLNVQAGLMEREQVEVAREVAALSEVEQALIPLEDKTAELIREFDIYTEAVQERSFWLDVLSDVEALLPDGMFLLSSKPISEGDSLSGVQVSVVSYLDKEPEGLDAVGLLRDSFRESERFSDRCAIASRPSRQQFARSFVLDLFFEEVP